HTGTRLINCLFWVSRPIDQSPKRRTPFRFEAPDFGTGFRVDGDDVFAWCGSKHHSVLNDRIALNVVAAIAAVIDPCNLKIGDVLAVDLVQHGVPPAPIIAM